MNRNLVHAMLFVLVSCGCRTCDSSCDYLPPVLDGPYSSHGLRSGSAIANRRSYAEDTVAKNVEKNSNSDIEKDIEMAAPLTSQAITPIPMPE